MTPGDLPKYLSISQVCDGMHTLFTIASKINSTIKLIALIIISVTILFKAILKLSSFRKQKLSRKHVFKIINRIVIFMFIISILSILGSVVSDIIQKPPRKLTPQDLKEVALVVRDEVAQIKHRDFTKLEDIAKEKGMSLSQLLDQLLNEAQNKQERGMVLLAKGEFLEAAELFEEDMNISKERAAVDAFYQGNSYFWANRFEQALVSYQTAVQLDSMRIEAHNNLGLILNELGKYKEADLIFAKATEIIPRNHHSYPKRAKRVIIGLYTNWAITLSQLNKCKQATQKCAKAIELDPKTFEAYMNWGMALRLQGQHEQAITKYAEAAKLDSTEFEVYWQWGFNLHKLGQYHKAARKYAKAAELDSTNSRLYNNWGATLLALGRYDEAITKYTKAIEIDPDYAEAYNGWGVALLALGRYEEAITKYTKAVETDPDCATAYDNWGATLRALGKSEEAKAMFEKARTLRVYPQNN